MIQKNAHQRSAKNVLDDSLGGLGDLSGLLGGDGVIFWMHWISITNKEWTRTKWTVYRIALEKKRI